MLIKCPDCRKSISSDCDNCIHCGCKINSSEMIFEIAPRWSGLGIASFVMIFGYVYYISLVMMIESGISMATVDDDSNVIISLCIMCFFVFLYPTIQLVLGIIPLRSGTVYHRWPSIAGIIGGIVGIFIDIAIVCSFVWLVFMK